MKNEKLTIAVIDDSEAIRTRLQQKIEKNKELEILWTAESAGDAMDFYLSNKPDVIILDLQLKESSGFRFLEGVRKIDNDTKIIMLTNFPYATFRNKCISLGGNYFFDKTNEFEEVFEILKSLKKEILN